MRNRLSTYEIFVKIIGKIAPGLKGCLGDNEEEHTVSREASGDEATLEKLLHSDEEGVNSQFGLGSDEEEVDDHAPLISPKSPKSK